MFISLYFQKALDADVGKPSAERTRKVQTRGLFSDDEDAPVRLARNREIKPFEAHIGFPSSAFPFHRYFQQYPRANLSLNLLAKEKLEKPRSFCLMMRKRRYLFTKLVVRC